MCGVFSCALGHRSRGKTRSGVMAKEGALEKGWGGCTQMISFTGACPVATFETHVGRQAVLKRMSEPKRRLQWPSSGLDQGCRGEALCHQSSCASVAFLVSHSKTHQRKENTFALELCAWKEQRRVVGGFWSQSKHPSTSLPFENPVTFPPDTQLACESPVCPALTQLVCSAHAPGWSVSLLWVLCARSPVLQPGTA